MAATVKNSERRGLAPGRRVSDARRRASDAKRAEQRRGLEFSEREARMLEMVGEGYSAGEIVEVLQAGRRGDDPPRPRGETPVSVPHRAHQPLSVALAGLAFAAILIPRLILGADADPLLSLMVVPIAALAVGFETRGGLLGAAIASMLVAALAITDDYGVQDVFVQIGAFAFTGMVVGRLAAGRKQLLRDVDAARRSASSPG